MLHLNYTSVSYLMARKDVTIRIMLDDDDLKTAVAPFETNGGKEQKNTTAFVWAHTQPYLCFYVCFCLVQVNNMSRWSTVFIRMKLNTLLPLGAAMKQLKDVYEK